MNKLFTVKFWGVRGSYPAPGSQTLQYGGNTPCVEINAGGQTIIENFTAALKAFPALAMNLVRALSARVRLANEQIQTLATLDVYGRVARQLLAFSEKYGQAADNGAVLIPIRLTQGDIADLVGASRKRVNQVMVAFKGYNYISVDAVGRIIVQDRAALARFC